MVVKQIADFTNEIVKEVLGEENLVQENLEGIVDVGNSILSSVDNKENWLKSLTDRIARFEISNRLFNVEFPSLFRENYEWGSAREVVDIDLMSASETQTWNLIDGQEYPDNIFYGATADVKFFNSKTTFTIAISRTDEQIKSAFLNEDEYISFVNGLEIAVRNSITIRKNALSRRVINSLIGDTIYDDYGSGDMSASSGQKAINVLYLYNQTVDSADALTVDNCFTSREFLKFLAKTIADTSSYMKAPSTAFNVNGRVKNTPEDYMHTILLQSVKSSLEYYLDSETFHDEYITLKNLGTVETTPYWQGMGTGSDTYSFDEISGINIITASGNTVNASGIVGVIYDHYACGITQENPRTTAHYVSSAEFTNEWYKEDASYFENLNEQCVVFFVA